MIPSVVANQVRETLLDYLQTTFHLADDRFDSELFEFLGSERGLFRGPFYEVRLPFQRASEREDIPLEIRPPFKPYRHQFRAFERLYSSDGHQPQHTLVATGTGSGKTECFLYPILDHCYRHREEPGVKAIVLYPMNALASDQARRIAAEIWSRPELRGHVSAGLYVGGKGRYGVMGEDHLIDDRSTLRQSPPDILLTNYRMLDFLLLRPDDRDLWRHNGPQTLRYLVLDELHTYDGAQGSDVACLLRRLKSRLGCAEGSVCCVGTSATVGDANAETRRELIDFARTVFEERFASDSVIGEERQSVDEALGERGGDDTIDLVPADAGDALDPSSYASREDWLRAQARLWLGDAAPAETLDEDGRVELAEALKRHDFLRQLMRVLERRAPEWPELDEALCRRDPVLDEVPPAIRRRLVDSFLALVSIARTREDDRLRPFLSVHLHLWLRELRQLQWRIPADLDERAQFDWLSDAPGTGPGQPSHWLPIAHCRECGAHGLAAQQLPALERIDAEASSIGHAWLEDHASVRFLQPRQVPAGSPLQQLFLCRSCLRLGDRPACPCGAGADDAAALPVIVESATSQQRPPRFLARCPDCGTEGALSILGSRAASLLSVAVSQLFLTPFNDDRKLLAFTDSVQDASHRAGFFGARTYTFNFRTALQSTLEAASEAREASGTSGTSEPLTLDTVASRLLEHWSEPSRGIDRQRLVATLLPPDLAQLPGYQVFLESPDGRHDALLDDLALRLSWEATAELGLATRVGRTLESTLCATATPSPEALARAAESLELELQEEPVFDQPPLQPVERPALEHFLRGLLHRTRVRGGIHHPLLRAYAQHDGAWFLLTRGKNRLISPFHRDSVLPRFLTDRQDRDGKAVFDPVVSPATSYTWYRDWAERTLGVDRRDGGINALYRTALRCLENAGLVSRIDSRKQASVWGLDPRGLLLTHRVARVRCRSCRRASTVAEEELSAWVDRRCPQYRCPGTLEHDPRPDPSYYRDVYRSGQLQRIFCQEHTGLLQRHEREDLETRFKEGSAPDAPNLLVCTPTLEMGIDIGDLSGTVMCSVPPAPANYLQRLGRAGRKTGNAFSLTVAVTRPHDLYFHAQPLEMLRGQVLPPGTFLDAPEMLGRQLVAFAMDRWAREEPEARTIPRKTSLLLGKAKEQGFPGRFLAWYEREREAVLEAFLARFDGVVSDASRERIALFARSDEIPRLVSGAFDEVERELQELRNLRTRTVRRRKEIEEDPELSDDPENELRELGVTLRILSRLTEETGGKYPLNVLTDAGVLPNYAFPEHGVTLQSVVASEARGKQRRYDHYEYIRPASAALRELAPFNHFYADGRRVRVDEIDIGTRAQPLVESWRLCPSCHHVERELDEGKTASRCPRCGHAGWADAGQRRAMVHFRRSRALASRLDSTTAASREEREQEFYRVLDLIDVGPDNYAGARLLQGDELIFGYELLRDVTLREVNFGLQHRLGGKNLKVAGQDLSESGFRVCLDCGRVQDPRHPSERRELHHAPYCRARKPGNKENLTSLFLYREMRSEAIRILLPVVDVDLAAKRASFKAALELGFRRHFRGDPGHLQLRVMDEPVRGTDQRRQYLVVYDAVPGGTGYLSELWHGDAFLAVLERALEALESCSCRQAGKDGCYRCLFAYQVQRELPLVSSRAAQKILRGILGRRDAFEATATLSEVDLSYLIESELEGKFLGALARWAREKPGASFEEGIKEGAKRWLLRLPGEDSIVWEVRPQVELGGSDGVGVACRPDFLIRPLYGTPGVLPVAVFCDGLAYHVCPGQPEGRLGDDLRKRSALVASGKYAVWSLTWRDVEEFESGRSPAPELSPVRSVKMSALGKLLPPEDFPLDAHVREQGSLPGLLAWLQRPDLDAWRRLASALATAWLVPGPFLPAEAADALEVRCLEERSRFNVGPVEVEGAPSSNAVARAAELPYAIVLGRTTRTALQASDLGGTRWLVRLFDQPDERAADDFAPSWRGLLHASNLLQFHPDVELVSSEGLEEAWPAEAVPASEAAESLPLSELETDDPQLAELLELATEAGASLIRAVAAAGLPLPVDDFELDGSSGRVGAGADLAWPEARIAVLSELQAQDRSAFEAAGWTVLVHPVAPETLTAALERSLAS